MGVTFFRNGEFEGEHKGWFDNGNPSDRSFYQDGVKTGESKVWRVDGALFTFSYWINNKRIGRFARRKSIFLKLRRCLYYRVHLSDFSKFLISDLRTDLFHGISQDFS